VQSGIGSTLREARKRRKIELSEVEAATKIRAGFLRAIEDENWEALPGDAYARGFVRTYAGFLGLDGARLAAEVPAPPAPPAPGAGERWGRSRRTLVAAVCLVLVGVAVAIGLVWSGEGTEDGPALSGAGRSGAEQPSGIETAPASALPNVRHATEGNSGAVNLSLTTKAELWVCLLDEEGKPLVDGIVLPAGAEEGPFRSGSFTVSFGNGEVEMQVDGRDTDIPESASPLGYDVGRDGELSPLSESERPTCT
jgi:cytoskeleton protein RodZ